MAVQNKDTYVQAGTDKKNLAKKYVYYGHSVTVQGASFGSGGSYAYLKMSIQSVNSPKTAIIYAY